MSNDEFSSGRSLTTEEPSLDEIKKLVRKLENDLKTTKYNLEKSKFDIVTLLAVFVGLITYLGLEIQVFKNIESPLMIVGISIFFISSILLFVLTINHVMNHTNTANNNIFKQPLYWILIPLLITAIYFIIAGTNQNDLGQSCYRLTFLNLNY